MKGLTTKIELLETPYLEDMETFCHRINENNPYTIGYDNVHFEHDKDVLVVLSTDWHLGSKYVDYDLWWEHIKTISDTKGVYTILCGDYIDGFGKRSHGAGIYDQCMLVPEARELAFKGVKRLASRNKILGVILGCHDSWAKMQDGYDLAKDMAQISKSYWLGSEGIVNLHLNELDYSIFARHKYESWSSSNILWGLKKRYIYKTPADIFFGGHRHQAGIECAYIRGQYVYFLRGGAFKRTDGWLISKGFPLAEPTMPGVLLSSEGKKNITMFMNHLDGIEYIEGY